LPDGLEKSYGSTAAEEGLSVVVSLGLGTGAGAAAEVEGSSAPMEIPTPAGTRNAASAKITGKIRRSVPGEVSGSVTGVLQSEWLRA
jgi:hypothetical protein